MSSIDERVVKLEMQNAQFEKNANTTMSTLAKLKNSLNFDKASSSLQTVATAANRMSFNGLAQNVSAISDRFSTLGIVGMTAIQNITTSVMNLAGQIGRISFGSIISGFQEYETQIGAVQTILANTQSKGTTIDDVNAALDELNHYADQTIYNFTEMTRNIGTFTAAGVGLDESVNAIKGIANLAAVSGSTSVQASTAMYQLSQALATGRVSLMDWNSVVNAGMGGEVFQEALKRTARNMGYAVDDIIAEYGSFRDSLTEGQWLTADVLIQTLNQIAGAYSEADLLSQGYTQDQVDQILQLADTAKGAATDVKTFSQLWDTTKEAMQSGWTQTWELIIGDFEEAKASLSDLSEIFSTMINDSANARNELVQTAMDSNWDRLIDALNEQGITKGAFEEQLTTLLNENGIAVTDLTEQYGSLSRAFQEGAVSSDYLRTALDNMISSTEIDLSGISAGLSSGAGFEGFNEDVAKIQKTLKNLGYDLGTFGENADGVDGQLGGMTESALRAFQAASGLEVTGIVDDATLQALQQANDELSQGTDEMYGWIDAIDQLGGRQLLFDSLKNIIEAVQRAIEPVKAAFENIFPPLTAERLYDMIAGFEQFTENLTMSEETAGKVQRIFEGFFSIFKIIGQAIEPVIGLVQDFFTALFPGDIDILGWLANIGDMITGFSKSAEETGFFQSIADKFAPTLARLANGISAFFDSLDFSVVKEFFSSLDFSSLGSFFQDIWNSIKNLFSSIFTGEGNVFARFSDMFDFSVFETGGTSDPGILQSFGDRLSDAMNFIGNGLQKFWDTLKSFDWSTILDNLRNLFGTGLIGAITLFVMSLRSNGKGLTGAITGIMDNISGIFKQFTGEGAISRATVGVLNQVKDAIEQLGGVFEEAQGVVKAYKNQIRAESLLKIATALLVLVGAVMLISTVDPERLSTSVAAISLLFAELIGAMFLMGKSENSFKNMVGIGQIAGYLILISAGILVLSHAVERFAEIDAASLTKGIVAVGAALGMLAAFSHLKLNNMGVLNGVGTVILASSLLIIYNAVKLFAGLDTASLIKGGAVVAAMLTAVALATRAMSGTAGGAAAMLLSAVALTALAAPIALFGQMSLETIAKGLIAVAGVFVVFGLAGAIIAPLAGILLSVAAAFALFGAAAALIAGAVSLIATGLTTLAALGTAGAAGLTAAITAMVAVIPQLIKNVGEGLVSLAEVISDNADKFGDAFVAIVTAILNSIVDSADQLRQAVGQIIDIVVQFISENFEPVANALFDLLITAINTVAARAPELIDSISNLVSSIVDAIGIEIENFDTSNLIQVFGAMGIVVAIFAILAGVSGLAKKALPAAGMMLVVFGIVGTIFVLLGSFDTDTTLNTAISLSLILGALTIATGILGSGLVNIAGALQGVGAMAVVVAGIGVILAILGGLKQIPGFDWLMGEGMQVLSDFGYALGDFVGSIIGGFGAGISSGFPEIGQNLSDFATNVEPFLTTMSGLNESILLGTGYLAGAILAITATNVISGIASFLGGGDSVSNFGAQIAELGPYIADFAKSVEGIDATSVEAASNAALALAALATNLPKEGGWVQAITGTVQDLGEFGGQLPTFGANLKAYADSVAGIDGEAVTNSTTAAQSLAELANNLPKSGGLAQWFTGESDFATFGSQLVSFGQSMVDYSQTVAGIDGNTFTNSNIAANSLVTLAESIPDTGGLVSWIFGDNDLGNFGEQIKTFGSAMADYSSTIAGIDGDAVTNSATAGQALAALNESLPDTGGIKSWFVGDANLGTFGGQLKKFGEGIAGFSEEISGVDTSRLSSVTETVTSLGDLASELAGKDMSGLNNLNDALKSAGTDGMGAFMDAFTESVDLTSVETTFTGISSKAFTTLNSKQNLFRQAGRNLMSALQNGISSYTNAVANQVLAICSASLDVAWGYYNPFYSAGLNMMAGLSAGIYAGNSAVVRTATIVAQNALDAVNRKLDINSPSRELMKTGMYADMGLAQGLNNYASLVNRAGENVGNTALSSISKSVDMVASKLDSDLSNIQPTITPVVDLNNVRYGAQMASSMLSGMYGFSDPYAMRMASSLSWRNTPQTVNANVNNTDVVAAINQLGSRVDDLGNRISQMQVRMDTGALVGQVQTPLDRGFGRTTKYKERGI